MKLRFEPSGTHVKNGVLKVRFDFIPDATDKSYPLHHLYVVDQTSKEFLRGYKGKTNPDGSPVDEVAYQAWLDGLPHIWITTPCLCHFVQIDDTTDLQGLANYLQSVFIKDRVATIDDCMSKPASEASHLISAYHKTLPKLTDKKVVDSPTLKDIINDKFKTLPEIIVEAQGGEIEPITPKSIDVGDPADNLASYYAIANFGTERTACSRGNPANATGALDTVAIYISYWSGSNDVWPATYSASGNVLTCHDSESVGVVAIGLNTFDAVDIDVSSGEYMGVGCKNSYVCRVDWATSGGSGVWTVTGEYVDPADSATFTLDSGGNNLLSIYGTGTESGGGGWTGIAKVGGVTEATLSKMNSVPKANIAKIMGVAV